MAIRKISVSGEKREVATQFTLLIMTAHHKNLQYTVSGNIV